ncbi:reverse transcriptase (RNA-dependent DNA polymerase) [Rathayibacter sp. PhB152]|uniref:reverse transcriptase family protein n=1 Tax=Rathayibacter sp. PhB152 TaxID=2485190 RepID=UPI000FA2A7E6|nr:reverse transcriptase family protein [Rathayibacter sp. PhB152]ROQ64933.1 reverse transcriptase (RNA-dependent DNA polymerase) [Rathayibacter sp. PhB152]
MHGRDAVVEALAHAFLGAEWTPAGLRAAAADSLGARRRWIGPLVTAVLVAFPHPPLDAPRELAQVVAGLLPERAQPVVAHLAPVPARAVPSSSPVPAIDGRDDLARLLGLAPAQLDGFADLGQWNRRTPHGAPNPGALQNYDHVWRQRPGRAPRLLEVPRSRLRAVQRSVLDEIVGLAPVHPAAHGFVPGRSAITGAAVHTGSAMLITLDLQRFFAQVTAARVFRLLRGEGLPEAVAFALTGLCTHAVPVAAIHRMPAGGEPEERAALRRSLALAHLPQGAPTSPALANLALRRLDARLTGYAEAAGARYTRYADDLAFSGGTRFARRAEAFSRGAARIVEDAGYAVNPRKTRLRPASTRQSVTGIVVNAHPAVRRADVDRLHAILHNCAVHGPAGQNRAGVPDFRAHLLGRIAWVSAVHPGRGAKLRAVFERIPWPEPSGASPSLDPAGPRP